MRCLSMWGALLLLLLLEACDPAAPPGAPNVLIALLDDLGTDKVSAYREHPDAPPTPVIDALADQGMLFRNAYASPVCSPSRAALLTGRHGQRYGLGDTVETGDAYQVPLDEVFLPERLGDMGYGSVALGKWHLAHPDSRSYLRHPERAGFDAFAGTMRNFNPDEFDYTRWEKVVDGSRSVVTTYATTDTFDDAIEAVRTLPEPWLAYVAPQAPHSPWHVPPDPLNLAGVTAADDDLAKYDAMVRAADAELGRLLAEVDLATTYVFVLGDNGTPRQATTPPFDPNGAKTKMAEGGIGVPLVVAGPTVAPGTETGALAHVVDVFATVAELAGADVSDLELDGVSLVDTLVDPGLERRAFVYVERFGDAGLPPEVGVDRAAVRDVRGFKLWVVDGVETLHDLEGRVDDGPDLLEAGPLSEESSEAWTRLRAHLSEMRERVAFEY